MIENLALNSGHPDKKTRGMVGVDPDLEIGTDVAAESVQAKR
jgi:hypothetical protein